MQRPSFPLRRESRGSARLGFAAALLALFCQLAASQLALAQAASASLLAAFDQAAVSCGAGHDRPHNHHPFPETALGAPAAAPGCVLALASAPGPVPRPAAGGDAPRRDRLAVSPPPPARAPTSFARAPPTPA